MPGLRPFSFSVGERKLMKSLRGAMFVSIMLRLRRRAGLSVGKFSSMKISAGCARRF
jgi:hypothetical protein